MPSNRTISVNSDIYKFTNKKYSIQYQPFYRLLTVVNSAVLKFRKPWLLKYVVYLPTDTDNISSAIAELQRIYTSDGRPALYFHWSKEYKLDSTHNGLHWHLVLIGEARDWDSREYNVKSKVDQCLHTLLERGYINNFSHSAPKTVNARGLRGTVADPEGCADLLDWLSYDCKAETKDGLGGRLYGCSRVPVGTAPLAVPALQQQLAA